MEIVMQKGINLRKERKRTIVAIFSFLICILFLSGASFPADIEGTGNLTGHIFSLDRATPVSGAVVKAKSINDGVIYTSSPSDSNGAFMISGMKEGIYVVGITTPQGDFNIENLIGIKENQTAKISFSLSPYEEKVAEAIVDLYGEEAAPELKEKRISKEQGDIWEVRIGKVVSYNLETRETEVNIELGLLQLGDEIHIKGYTTDFYQKVEKIYLEGSAVNRAFAGQTPFVEVEQRVEIGDFVYLVCKKRGIAQYFRAPGGMASIIAGVGAILYGFITETGKEEGSPFKK